MHTCAAIQNDDLAQQQPVAGEGTFPGTPCSRAAKTKAKAKAKGKQAGPRSSPTEVPLPTGFLVIYIKLRSTFVQTRRRS